MSEEVISVDLGYDEAHAGYIHMPSLQPAHDLDADLLRMYTAKLERSFMPEFLIAAAWSKVELAQVINTSGDIAQAADMLAAAELDLVRCESRLLQPSRQKRDGYVSDRYRFEALNAFMPYFIGAVSDQPPAMEVAELRKNVYRTFDRAVVQPLLKGIGHTATHKQLRRSNNYSGRLGEAVVLQAINRLDSIDGRPDGIAVPASSREDCRDPDDSDGATHAFDVKVVFPDRTFTPVEVKWSRRHDVADAVYDKRIARLYIHDPLRGHDIGSISMLAQLMHWETSGVRLTSTNKNTLDVLSNTVMQAVTDAGATG